MHIKQRIEGREEEEKKRTQIVREKKSMWVCIWLFFFW
jgi:hypothetical protein